MAARDARDASLPFDVAVDRMPVWALAASTLVIAASVLVALRLLPMLVVVPFLIASSLGRRFASVPTHVEVSDEALSLGDRVLPRAAIVDVWVDEDASDPIAVVASGERVDVAIVHLDNGVQASRFGAALGDEWRRRVVGHRVRPIDLLPSLRFVALAAAFAATGAPYGLLLLGVFALIAWPLVQAKQLVAGEHGFEVRTLLGVHAHAYDEVASVDPDAGVIALKDGAELRLPRGALRDAVGAAPPYLERARTRALLAVRAATRR
jgi:hypothetical protein